MDEKEIEDTTDSIDNLPEENTDNDNDFVEVVENEKIEDTEDIQQQNNNYPSSTNKLTAVVYLVIFISICIGLYFYVTQNKDILNKLLGKDTTNSGQIETLTGDIDNTTNIGVETDNINTGNIEDTNLKENTNNIANEKDPSTSSTTTISGSTNKSEDVIIKDFEKELDSLFNMIDENAK